MITYKYTPETGFFVCSGRSPFGRSTVGMTDSLGMELYTMQFIKKTFAIVMTGMFLSSLIPQPAMARTLLSTATQPKVQKTMKVVLTAYSSTVDQTDDTPFLTASQKMVEDGIVANNLLPFGTKIRIPKLYGSKIFVVEDRMNKRKSLNHFDVWMESRQMALKFGVKSAENEVLAD